MALFGSKTKEVAETDSLVVAFHGLLSSFGLPYKPKEIAKALDAAGALAGGQPDDLVWNAISDLDDSVSVTEVGYLGTWPTTRDAVIKFQYQPVEEPYLEVDGERVANIVDHYCLMADINERTVIDSADGLEKSPGFYGQPVGWASYEVVPDPVGENAKVDPSRWYKKMKDDTLWSIARRFGTTATELAEHNGIEDLSNIPEGTVLHLPMARTANPDRPITYEVFASPKKMHVSQEGGAKKFSFSNVHDWKDLLPSGPTYPEGANLEVAAVAHVPIGSETAAYFMDALALGNYKETGMPAYTIGFNHSHLAEGYVEKPKPQPVIPEAKAEKLRILINNAKDDPSPGLATFPTTALDLRDPDPDPMSEANQWHQTYVVFEDGPRRFVSDQAMWIHDYMGKRPDRQLDASQDVVLSGTFIKEDVLYGRPQGAAKNFLWYGIPMSNLISEDELYNTNIPLAERVAMPNGRLSYSERGVVALAKVLSQTTRLKTYLSNKNKK